MPDQNSFRDVQSAFTRHVRDPDNAPPPADIEDRRMGVYRDLLYNNVQSFMADSFPVLRRIMPDGDWHGLMRDYFRGHRARTPLFPKMPGEFLQYLQHERVPREDDLPFMYELAHYEWMEMVVAMDARDPDLGGIDPGGDMLDGVPVLSPLARPLVYRWPVHRIGPDYLPREAPAQPTYIIVYRDAGDEVGFLELNPVSAKLVECLTAGDGRTGRELLQAIADELGHPQPEVVINGGLDILETLRGKDIVLGTRKTL